MEILGLIELPAWLVSIILCVLTVVLYTVYKRGTFRRLGIATRPSKFLIGDFIRLAKEGVGIYDVESTNRYGKVYGSFWGNMPVLIVADTDVMKEILVKQFPSFQERFRFRVKPTGMNSSVSVAEGVHWKYLRSTLSPSFTTSKIRAMNANIENCLETLHKSIQDMSGDNPEGFDFFPMLRAYTLDVICKVGFGVDVDSQKDPDNPFVRNASQVVKSSFGSPIVLLNVLYPDCPGLERFEVQFTAKEPAEFFMDATKAIFEERKKSDTTHADLLQTMMNARNEDDKETYSASERKTQTIEELKRKGLTDDEVITNSLVFMIAGFETTATTLAWLVYDMAVYPDCQEKLIQEIDRELGQETPNHDSLLKLRYLDMVINETMRYHPAAPGMTRRAVEDTEVCGITIPKGMCIIFSAFAINFMPEYWQNPQEYNPERFAPENKDNLNEYAYFPFGIGPRNCIGMRLALLEVKMTLVSILQQYRIVRADKLEVPMPGTKKGFYQPDKPVLVKLVKRI